MATDADPELGKLRHAVDRAVRDFVTYRVSLYDEAQHEPYVVGWAVFTEYTDQELTQNDLMGTMAIVPDDQPASMSGGLFGAGARAFGQ